MSDLAFPEITDAPAQTKRAVAPVDLRALALTRFGDWRSQAAALVAKFANVAFPVSTPKGYDEAKRALAEVRAPRYAAQNVSKASKSELATVSKAVGAEEQAVIDALAATEAAIKAQIDAEDERKAAEKAERERIEAARIEKHEQGLSTIRSYLTRCQAPAMTSERIATGIAMLEAVDVGAEWQEYEVAATTAKGVTLTAMRDLYAAALVAEDDARQREAQRVENARVAAELAAERQRIADEAAAVKAAAADLQRKINEQAAKEAKAERDAAAVEAAQRAEADRLERLAEQQREAREAETLEAERAAILAAEAPKPADAEIVQAEHVDTYLPPSAPAVPYEAPAPAAEPEPLFVSLDDINVDIGDGFWMRADFVHHTLGITPEATDNGASFYSPAQRSAILRALAKHCEALA